MYINYAPRCPRRRTRSSETGLPALPAGLGWVRRLSLERSLLAEIDPTEDNLRLYRLPDSRGSEVREHGTFRATDFNGPLVL